MPEADAGADTPAPGFELLAGMGSGRSGEILDAAMRVFVEHGYESGSMRDIARTVGVTEPAIYRHFAGKEALFVALIRAAGGRIRDEAVGLIDGVHPELLRPELIGALASRRRSMEHCGCVLRTVLEAGEHHPVFRDEYRATIAVPVREALTAKARQLDRAYGCRSTPAERTGRVRALLALIAGYFVTSAILEDESDEAIADAVLRVMGW